MDDRRLEDDSISDGTTGHQRPSRPSDTLASELPAELPEDGRQRSNSSPEHLVREDGAVNESSQTQEDIFKSPFAEETQIGGHLTGSAASPLRAEYASIETPVFETHELEAPELRVERSDSDVESRAALLDEIDDMPLRERSDSIDEPATPRATRSLSESELETQRAPIGRSRSSSDEGPSRSGSGSGREDGSHDYDEALSSDGVDLANFDPSAAVRTPALAPAYGSVQTEGFGNTGYTAGTPAAGGSFFSRLSTRISSALKTVTTFFKRLAGNNVEASGLAALDDLTMAAPSASRDAADSSSLAPSRSASIDLGNGGRPATSSPGLAANAAEISDETRADARNKARGKSLSQDESRSRGPSLGS